MFRTIQPVRRAETTPSVRPSPVPGASTNQPRRKQSGLVYLIVETERLNGQRDAPHAEQVIDSSPRPAAPVQPPVGAVDRVQGTLPGSWRDALFLSGTSAA